MCFRMYEWLDNLLGITWYFWVLVGLLGFVFMSTTCIGNSSKTFILFADCLYELTKYTAVQDSHKENTVDAVSRQLDSINVFRAQVA